jgi:hypothetical protein
MTMSARLTRSGPWVTVLGVVVLLLGLTIDAALHRRDPGLAARESLGSLANPGHALLGLGIALVVVGSGVFLLGRLVGPGRSLAARGVLGLSLAGLLGLSTISLGAVAAAGRAEAGGHAHGPTAGGAHAHEAGGEPTADERAAAERLLADTRAGSARFAELAVAEAEGYRKVQVPGMALPEHWPAHYVNAAYVRDGRVLDPSHPETLVYVKLRDGRTVLLGAMYLAPGGEAPSVGGPLTAWHAHPGACFGPEATVGFVGRDGRCPAGMVEPARQPEMLHVWFYCGELRECFAARPDWRAMAQLLPRS